MSDILIRGMEMPKAQFQKTSTLYHLEGTIFVYPDGKARAELSVDYNKRKSHPLVPVPPHGDLIDRDALMDSDGDLWDGMWGWSGVQIANAPTIIEAEEGK